MPIEFNCAARFFHFSKKEILFLRVMKSSFNLEKSAKNKSISGFKVLSVLAIRAARFLPARILMKIAMTATSAKISRRNFIIIYSSIVWGKIAIFKVGKQDSVAGLKHSIKFSIMFRHSYSPASQ
ncbi:MAG: hypothetical protein HDR38_06820 [Treponema sp.]|nr:hypothetical protein [Treponema sp.]